MQSQLRALTKSHESLVEASSCSSPVRPAFGGRGWWTESSKPDDDDAYRSIVSYQPKPCHMLDRVRNKHGRKPAKYLHDNDRFDAALTSRLVWNDVSGRPQRALNVRAFLHRFRGTDVVIVGDSHSSILHQSLSILVGCTQPKRHWPEVEGTFGLASGGWRNGSISLVAPEYKLRIFRIATNILTPVVEKGRSAAAASYYVQNGTRMSMRAQATTKVVRLDVPGLGEWANVRHFRRAGLVLMKQGAWANNYRSDVKVFTRRGELGERAGDEAFAQMYGTGVERAIQWFDEVLPPTAVVIWMSGGANIVGRPCSDVRRGAISSSGLTRDALLLRALRSRRQRWVGCGTDLDDCARRKPRQWMLDVSAPQSGRPDLQMGCKSKRENGTVTDWHPAIPGMPDLWNAMALDSVLQDDVRCAARSQLE